MWRSRDDNENEWSRLPDEEHVEVAALWVTEIYTPSRLHGLAEGLHDLGWDLGGSRGNDLREWLAQARAGQRAGWTTLGLVSSNRRRTKPNFMSERLADLPPGVRAAFPMLMTLTPSLTALTTAFVLDADTASAINRPLRADYVTTESWTHPMSWWRVPRYVFRRKPYLLGRHMDSPMIKRRQKSAAVVSDLESRCSDWVARNLPGVFASEEFPGTFPTACLYLTAQSVPLSAGGGSLPRAFEGIGLDAHYDAWESEEWPACRLRLPRPWDDRPRRLTLACRRTDAIDDERHQGYSQPDSNWTIAQYGNDRLWGLLGQWALSSLLDGYHEMVSRHRDTASRKSHRPIRDGKRVRRLATAELFDVAMGSSEILGITTSKRTYQRSVLELIDFTDVGSGVTLAAALRRMLRARAKQLMVEGELLASVLATGAEVSQTISNTRTQRIVVVLTLVSSVLAGLALVVALNAGGK